MENETMSLEQLPGATLRFVLCYILLTMIGIGAEYEIFCCCFFPLSFSKPICNMFRVSIELGIIAALLVPTFHHSNMNTIIARAYRVERGYIRDRLTLEAINLHLYRMRIMDV